MQISENNPYDNIYPNFTYVANRKCSINWALKGPAIYDKHNLFLVYQGEAQLTCNDKTFHVKPGDLVYYKPGDYRKGYTFPDNLMECYTVDFLYTFPVFSQNQWKLNDLDLPFQTVEHIDDAYLYSRLLELFSKFTRTFITQSNSKTIRGRAIFMEILSLLTQWKSGDFVYDNVRKVEQVINYMTKNFTELLTLEELSNYAKISPSYLGSLFKSVTGKSPISYLIDIRLHKAKELLLDGHIVSDVADAVGFNDLYYFSKCFKKNEGISPSQYKRIANNDNDTFGEIDI
ncbi:MAG: AraC family transcriptional regulator [Firmicutes bacterium HGW-Firmicutes-7]|nr:MAG: AraC family transcriptional regulator [Firmicutes bacterium HGW-Firmicutes-7]